MKKFILSGEIDNASVKSVINNILEINESD